jgi:hypothetical protein
MALAVAVCLMATAESRSSADARATCPDLFRVVRSSASPGLNPISVAPADLDGDGNQDLAIAAGGSSSGTPQPAGVRVLLGAGDGTFSEALTSPEPVDAPAGLVVAGVNSDARPDLVVMSREPDRLTTLAGDGDGDFTALPPRLVGGGSMSLPVTADFNRDARADLAFTTGPGAGFGRKLHVLLADGAGGFEEDPGGQIDLPERAFSTVAGDFNRDGRVDLVVGMGLISSSLRVFLGDGTGSLSPVGRAFRWRNGGDPAFAVADLDGDADLDLVAIDGGQFLSVLLGDGTGRFRERRAARREFFNDLKTALVSADLNGDGHQDVAMAGLYNGLVTVLLGDGSGRLRDAPGSPERTRRYTGPGSLATTELNGDGRADLALLSTPTADTGELRLLLNTGAATGRGTHARLAIRQSRRRIPYGRSVRVSARLTCDARALMRRPLALYRRIARPSGAGPWRRIATRRARTTGTVVLRDRPIANAVYRWRKLEHDEPRFSDRAVVRVAQRVRATLQSAVTSSGVARRLTGRVLPRHGGSSVTLQRRYNSTWHNVDRMLLTPRSTYRFTLIRHRPGSYPYRVWRPADRNHAHGTSRVVILRVVSRN